MNKFVTLLIKELRELATPVILVPLIVIVGLFYGLGKISRVESRRTAAIKQSIAIIDHDQSGQSRAIIQAFEAAGFTITQLPTESINSALAQPSVQSAAALIDLPAGLANDLKHGTSPTIDVYEIYHSLALTSLTKSSNTLTALETINRMLGSQIIRAGSNLNPAFATEPLKPVEHVALGTRSAAISLSALSNYLTNQFIFIPIALLIVIVFASQLIATSIVSEKENKTLETLLSAPISRQAIISAKLLAAGLLALVFAAVYMVGFQSYINGIANSFGNAASLANQVAQSAASQLGLTLNVSQYVLIGISIFIGILCALAIALILGAFAEDVKSIQIVITPIILLVMIPYILINFFDVNTLSKSVRYLLYAIPFSQPFLAQQELAFGQVNRVWYGIGYELLFFGVLVYIASRIFSTDAIVTMKLKRISLWRRQA